MRTPFDHVLNVGGTGMLRGASIELARRSRAMTSIARTSRSLASLDRAIGARCAHQVVALDYRDAESLRSAVESAVLREGPIDLVVAWVHESVAPDSARIVAETAAAGSPHVRFIHVLGSPHADPVGSRESTGRAFRTIPSLDYRQVILGWAVSEQGESRWLTDEEISGGVIEAIDRGESLFIVGTHEPWSSRP